MLLQSQIELMLQLCLCLTNAVFLLTFNLLSSPFRHKFAEDRGLPTVFLRRTKDASGREQKDWRQERKIFTVRQRFGRGQRIIQETIY